MPHGLTHFVAANLIAKAEGALKIIETNADGDAAAADAVHEAIRVALENQVKIAETLDLIKTEFDKFESGLDKIL